MISQQSWSLLCTFILSMAPSVTTWCCPLTSFLKSHSYEFILFHAYGDFSLILESLKFSHAGSIWHNWFVRQWDCETWELSLSKQAGHFASQQQQDHPYQSKHRRFSDSLIVCFFDSTLACFLNLNCLFTEFLLKLHSLILTNNRLVNLAEIDPLASLPKLQFLSLLDNNVTKKPNYRLYVIHKLKSLRVLDFKKVRQKVRSISVYLKCSL